MERLCTHILESVRQYMHPTIENKKIKNQKKEEWRENAPYHQY